jgi:hypothetical protein
VSHQASASDHVMVLMGETGSTLDPIGSVINASVDMRSTTCSDSPRPFTVSLSMGESILDGQSGRTLDCFVVNNSFCNTGTPRQAEGAWKGEGTNWATKGSSDMRESMRNADKYGHVENAR